MRKFLEENSAAIYYILAIFLLILAFAASLFPAFVFMLFGDS